jgi:hypothetical protein
LLGRVIQTCGDGASGHHALGGYHLIDRPLRDAGAGHKYGQRCDNARYAGDKDCRLVGFKCPPDQFAGDRRTAAPMMLAVKLRSRTI